MLYLRYRNSESDAWTIIPSVTASFPSQPTGTLPVRSLRLQSAPEDVTPCGCAASSPNETHYALLASVPPMPQAAINDLLLFLLNYKQAAYREAKHVYYIDGEFVSAALSLLDVKFVKSLAEISFRLAAPLSDIL